MRLTRWLMVKNRETPTVIGDIPSNVYFMSVSRLFQGISKVFHEYFKGISCLSNVYFMSISRVLYFIGVLEHFMVDSGCFLMVCHDFLVVARLVDA